MTTWGGRAGRIALAAASFAMAGVALEVALRLLGAGPVPVNPDQRSLWAHHPKLGWTSRAGYEGTFDNGFFSVHVAINSRGLRGDEVSLQKPVGVRRVLVVGDSFGWGFGVEQEDTFGARLERALPDTEVINGAVSGYSTDQVLLWLRLEGRQYAPDVVVYALSGNDDIMNHMQVAYWTYYKPSYGLDRHAGLLLQGVPVPKAGLSERLRTRRRPSRQDPNALSRAGHRRAQAVQAPGSPASRPSQACRDRRSSRLAASRSSRRLISLSSMPSSLSISRVCSPRKGACRAGKDACPSKRKGGRG